MDTRYDVIVVGARCAGAATAMLLARRGASVLLVNRAPEGSDTLSTHALMRGGVQMLARWGLYDEVLRGGTPALRTTTFHYGEASVTVPIKPRDGVDALVAPRRTLLDPILVGAARLAGVEVCHGVGVRALLRGRSGRVCGVVLEKEGIASYVSAGLVVGADGMRSTVARLVNAPTTRTAAHTTSVVYGYWPLDVDGSHWYFRPGVGAGKIPTNDGLTCVFVAVPPARFEADLRGNLESGTARALAEIPELARELAGRRRVGPLRPFAGRLGYMRRPHGPGWALVGDAGYFKDPLTAHGITDALRDADGLARAVAAGAPERFEEERDAMSVELFELTDRIASFAWDLDEIQRLHRELSEAMNREVASMAAKERLAA